jgi:hypothetical protein
VSPVRYEQGSYITEDDILHSHRSEHLKSYTDYLCYINLFGLQKRIRVIWIVCGRPVRRGRVAGVNLSVIWPPYITYLVIRLLTCSCLHYNIREL